MSIQDKQNQSPVDLEAADRRLTEIAAERGKKPGELTVDELAQASGGGAIRDCARGAVAGGTGAAIAGAATGPFDAGATAAGAAAGCGANLAADAFNSVFG